jgi:hypothetical protein
MLGAKAPGLGRNFEAMDPLEWLARMADHIPDPGKHRTNFHAHYANRVRGQRRPEQVESERHEQPPKKRRCLPTWARLIAKVYHSDPLTCRRCGGKLKVVAYVSDQISIKCILEELGLNPPQEEKPPPIRAVVRVPVDDEGREIPAR